MFSSICFNFLTLHTKNVSLLVADVAWTAYNRPLVRGQYIWTWTGAEIPQGIPKLRSRDGHGINRRYTKWHRSSSSCCLTSRRISPRRTAPASKYYVMTSSMCEQHDASVPSDPALPHVTNPKCIRFSLQICWSLDQIPPSVSHEHPSHIHTFNRPSMIR